MTKKMLLIAPNCMISRDDGDDDGWGGCKKLCFLFVVCV